MKKLVLVAVLGFTLSSCVMTDDNDRRHLQPLSSQIVAEMTGKNMSPADPILIRIYKKESELEVWKRTGTGSYALLKTYPMYRWSGQLGPKRSDGDRQAPEGFYTVTPGQMNPKSQYFLSFNLGYPNPLEKAQGFSGSALMVHGACTSAGCYAMTNGGISEIYALAREALAAGQASFQVQALPFRLKPENMVKYRDNPNIAFWKNLKEGSDHFEASKQPPRVAACERKYVFNAVDASGPFEPTATCPAYNIEAGIATLVTQKQQADNLRISELIASGAPPVSYTYVDGGMHSSFRSTLKSFGPDKLQLMTSGNVEVSRPDAALSDPF